MESTMYILRFECCYREREREGERGRAASGGGGGGGGEVQRRLAI